MLKRIIKWTLYSIFVGFLIFGAINRTIAHDGKDRRGNQSAFTENQQRIENKGAESEGIGRGRSRRNGEEVLPVNPNHDDKELYNMVEEMFRQDKMLITDPKEGRGWRRNNTP